MIEADSVILEQDVFRLVELDRNVAWCRGERRQGELQSTIVLPQSAGGIERMGVILTAEIELGLAIHQVEIKRQRIQAIGAG